MGISTVGIYVKAACALWSNVVVPLFGVRKSVTLKAYF